MRNYPVVIVTFIKTALKAVCFFVNIQIISLHLRGKYRTPLKSFFPREK